MLGIPVEGGLVGDFGGFRVRDGGGFEEAGQVVTGEWVFGGETGGLEEEFFDP